MDPQLTTGWAGLAASKKIGKFLEAGQTEAVASHDSDCYYCWKEKTQQFLGGAQNLG